MSKSFLEAWLEVLLAGQLVEAVDDVGSQSSVERQCYEAASTEAWESGIQLVGPPRLQRLWFPLTRIDHPERLWELRRLDSNPLPPEEQKAARTEIVLGELFELAGGFLRFWLSTIWARAKAFLATKRYPLNRSVHTDRQLHR